MIEQQAEQSLKELDITLNQANEMISMADALNRLYNNSDFKKVILEGYFKTEASRAVLLKSDNEMQEDTQQKGVNNIITGIGGLYQYFHKTFQIGEMARAEVPSHEQTREEILQEQLIEDTIQ